ncbi:MAG: 3-keto-5-aminohexanoate cleavage protein [Desulfosarcina sp.]|nr:3-keto-5-aminohexanoate cleavage protein [Desulfobacterales bacterium]
MTNNPFIITCPVTGAELSKDDTPHLPVTPAEIAQSAEEAVFAGASIIHLHVRDEQGNPTQREDIFESVTQKILRRCDCILQYSTGGAVGTPIEKRMAPLKLKPDMASLSMGTMNFGDDVFENTTSIIRSIAGEMEKNGIMPELEIFDYGMMDTTIRFLSKGYLPKKFHVNFVLGVPGGMDGNIENLISLKNRLNPMQTWTVTGVGKFQLPLAIHAIMMGGHVRIGFEDNIYFRKGELAKTNAQLIKRIVRIAKELGRPAATLSQTRKMLGLYRLSDN